MAERRDETSRDERERGDTTTTTTTIATTFNTTINTNTSDDDEGLAWLL